MASDKSLFERDKIKSIIAQCNSDNYRVLDAKHFLKVTALGHTAQEALHNRKLLEKAGLEGDDNLTIQSKSGIFENHMGRVDLA